jgi:hypothetical protein
MGDGTLLAGLVELARQLAALLWALIAVGFDYARKIGPLSGAMLLGVACIAGVGTAMLMQARLVRRLRAGKDAEVSMVGQELLFTIPGMILYLLALPFILIGDAIQSAQQRRKARKEAAAKADAEASDKPDGAAATSGAASAAPARESAPPAKEVERPPALVATIGPTFTLAALFVAVLYVGGVALEPLLRRQIGASPGSPVWEILILGGRPELQWYVPLMRYPWLGAVVTGAFWFELWWWSGRILRVGLSDWLGKNLAAQADDPSVLPWWRKLFGAPELHEADETYRRWAKYPPLVAALLIAFAWLNIEGDPYRVSPSMFALTLICWTSWVIHLRLRGVRELEQPEEQAAPVQTVAARGWPDVLEELKQRHQIKEPISFMPPRPVEALPMSRADLQAEGVITPLLLELVPGGRLTHMQHVLLRTLSMQAYVHTDPPTPRDALELGAAGRGALEDRTGMRHRNQIVLAPEGSGKSTLAMLAACNTAIVHTRCALIITRDNERADATWSSIRAALEPSTLRWNVRVRRVGGDLVSDLSQGILPEIIVCSLYQLVVNVLDEAPHYAPFLESLGLLIIDDVESFCGPVEAHAQLSLRRLLLRVRELSGAADEAALPPVLALGADSMQDTAAWARGLLGVDAVSRMFNYSSEEASQREASAMAAAGVSVGGGEEVEGKKPADKAAAGPVHHLYRLNDLRDADDMPLDARRVVESCERLSVPWHYRPCGDASRLLGRQRLNLRDEPRCYVPTAEHAAVVLLEGTVTEVRREIARLSRAGAQFEPIKQVAGGEQADAVGAAPAAPAAPAASGASVPIAFITIIDPDEEMALTELNRHSPLAHELVELPRPVVRPATGRVVLEHMAAELTTSWVEVADALDIFGSGAARALSRLADAGMLMTEERVDLHPELQVYQRRVYVRATMRALAGDAHGLGESPDQPLLPPKVSQVELPSGDRLAIRDRSTLALIDEADGTAGPHLYYLGRIFETAQGRFMVVGRAGEGGGDILAEPYLSDGGSSPRRRAAIRHIYREVTAEGLLGPARLAPPVVEPLLMGEFPLALSLGDVSLEVSHIATVRLDAGLGEVRQRTVYDAAAVAAYASGAFETVALGLYPNPAPGLGDAGLVEPPGLGFAEARLIAAAMRAVLPSMLRGAAGAIEVALYMEAARPADDDVLTSAEGFFLYDPHPGGNGAARSLHRDGVELLLRLVRVYLERVLYHDRLRARHDHWGDAQEILAGDVELDAAPPPALPGLRAVRSADAAIDEHAVRSGTMRERDRELRRRALVWLDSRLRPEGSLVGGRVQGQYGSGREVGEGDVWDIGRAWYSKDGAVTELLWSKHRWHLGEEAEAMVDVGFDRRTAAGSLALDVAVEPLLSRVQTMERQLTNGGFAQQGGVIWGTPQAVWSIQKGQDVAVGSDGALVNSQPVRALQAQLGALAMHEYAALAPLAILLRDRSEADAATVEGRHALIRYVSRFVQGIPSTQVVPAALPARSPVFVLLERLGDARGKSLLLAMLLRHCGLEAGIFWSEAEQDALCGVGAWRLEGDGAEAIRTWQSQVRLEEDEALWAEQPARPGDEAGEALLMVPVDPMRQAPPGSARVVDAKKWVFLPLGAAWFKLGVYEEGR